METRDASVNALATTPVKGLRLMQRDAIQLDLLGVADNRKFFLIDDRDRMVNGKKLGLLSALVAEFDGARGWLSIAFPSGEVVEDKIELLREIRTRFFSRELPADLVAGPWAEALSAYTGSELRLAMTGRNLTAVDRGRAGAVSLISRESIRRLEQLAGRAVDARRFRMLVEVDGVDAHAEDAWVGRQARIGNATVQFHGHVGRCLVTGHDPDTGVADMPTLELLRAYREELSTTEPLAFGIYGEVRVAGLIRRGDPVQLL